MHARPASHSPHSPPSSEFIRTFRKGGEYVYRSQLLQRYRRGQLWVEVDLGHLHDYEPRLLKHLQVSGAEKAWVWARMCAWVHGCVRDGR